VLTLPQTAATIEAGFIASMVGEAGGGVSRFGAPFQMGSLEAGLRSSLIASVGARS
jgi:hypothetical protein